MPPLGATFVPGGYDDYLMPEVFAPAPQRVMPEVPQNMQNDLQRMELEARSVEQGRDTTQSIASPPPHPRPPPPTDTQNYTRHYRGNEFAAYHNERYARAATASQAPENLPVPSTFEPFRTGDSDAAIMDSPSFSPFPKVKGDNIPLSASDTEDVLWNAREMVLRSNNVPMQIVWARDTLSYVEVTAEEAARERKRRGSGRERPPTPKVEHELRLHAVKIIEFLAEQGHPEATFMKGKWHEFGKFGYRESKNDAFKCYKKAADSGCGRAEYRMGMLYENSNDIEKAVEHYRIGTEQMNDSASNYRLGMLYLMGQHGFRRDPVRGIELINSAADSADEDAPQGSYVFGMLIARELPDIEIPEGLLPYELVLARQYMDKAAYLGFAKAQLKMGQAYELSQLGCDFNPSYSLHYYGLAARQGQPEAALGVSRWFLFGSQDGAFSKNEPLAFKYAQDAAMAGLATGEFAMGYYYEVGIHVPIDLREARKWYELAADHGNTDAMGRIKSLNESKSLTKNDHETTTLSRIKSQHGSMRGKRPQRFARQNDVMPSVSEDYAPPVPGKIPTPVVSPRQPPSAAQEHGLAYPDPARQSTLPAANLVVRPKSAAPYPEDDRPSPLQFGRSQSAAPYPDDDDPPGSRPQGPQLSPHYNPSIRPSGALQADRPMSAFGVRPSSSHSGPVGGPTLQPHDPRASRIPAGQPAAAAGWDSQAPAGYRQPSPGRQEVHRKPSPSQTTPYPNASPSAMAGPTGGAPVGDPTRNRLQKTNPNAKPQPLAPGRPASQYPAAAPYPAQNSPTGYGTQPGRDYGPRTSSVRPASDNYRQSAVPQGSDDRLPSSGQPERMDSRPPSAAVGVRVPVGGSGLPPKPRPGQTASAGGRASAPPAQQGVQHRPTLSPTNTLPHSASMSNAPGSAYGAASSARPAASPAAAAASQSGAPPKKGAATFDEMNIPQGKNDSDCVLM